MNNSTVLLVSTDDSLIESVGSVIRAIEPLRLGTPPTADKAIDWVVRGDVSLVVVHLVEDGSIADVTRLVRAITLAQPPVAALVVCDHYRGVEALAMLKSGVADYLPRPLDLRRLAYLIDSLTLRARRGGVGPGPDRPPESEPVHLLEDDRSFVYQSHSKMGRLVDQLKRIAPRDSTILLGGETGTGKSRLAGLVHRLSPRRGSPFLTINCGALSASLIESEIFGHVKGAFTGADADRLGKFAEVGQGTLFLDEVDSLPLSIQAKLLRAVEERVFEPVGSNKTRALRARLIAASNRPLAGEVAAGRFRADLYHRLNVIALTVPPLRERPGIMPHLVRGFIDEFTIPFGLPVLEIGPEALQSLDSYGWPGNIRELRNVIERAVAFCQGHVIGLDDLPDHFHGLARPADCPSATAPLPIPAESSLTESKEAAERTRIARALERHSNNRLRAAAELGISRMTLYNKLRKYGPLLGT